MGGRDFVASFFNMFRCTYSCSMAITQSVLLLNPRYEFTASVRVRSNGDASNFGFQRSYVCELAVTNKCREFQSFPRHVKCSHGYSQHALLLNPRYEFAASIYVRSKG